MLGPLGYSKLPASVRFRGGYFPGKFQPTHKIYAFSSPPIIKTVDTDTLNKRATFVVI